MSLAGERHPCRVDGGGAGRRLIAAALGIVLAAAWGASPPVQAAPGPVTRSSRQHGSRRMAMA